MLGFYSKGKKMTRGIVKKVFRASGKEIGLIEFDREGEMLCFVREDTSIRNIELYEGERVSFSLKNSLITREAKKGSEMVARFPTTY